jgi:hypothetical protein
MKRFIRWTVSGMKMHVSVCPTCRQFVGAAPDKTKLAITEATHRCRRTGKSRKLSPDASGTKHRVQDQ